MVQKFIATGTKKNASLLRACPVILNGNPTNMNVNILLLRSYDILVRMEWLEGHRETIDCLDNNFINILDNEENKL